MRLMKKLELFWYELSRFHNSLVWILILNLLVSPYLHEVGEVTVKLI